MKNPALGDYFLINLNICCTIYHAVINPQQIYKVKGDLQKYYAQ